MKQMKYGFSCRWTILLLEAAFVYILLFPLFYLPTISPDVTWRVWMSAFVLKNRYLSVVVIGAAEMSVLSFFDRFRNTFACMHGYANSVVSRCAFWKRRDLAFLRSINHILQPNIFMFRSWMPINRFKHSMCRKEAKSFKSGRTMRWLVWMHITSSIKNHIIHDSIVNRGGNIRILNLIIENWQTIFLLHWSMSQTPLWIRYQCTPYAKYHHIKWQIQ